MTMICSLCWGPRICSYATALYNSLFTKLVVAKKGKTYIPVHINTVKSNETKQNTVVSCDNAVIEETSLLCYILKLENLISNNRDRGNWRNM